MIYSIHFAIAIHDLVIVFCCASSTALLFSSLWLHQNRPDMYFGLESRCRISCESSSQWGCWMVISRSWVVEFLCSLKCQCGSAAHVNCIAGFDWLWGRCGCCSRVMLRFLCGFCALCRWACGFVCGEPYWEALWYRPVF